VSSRIFTLIFLLLGPGAIAAGQTPYTAHDLAGKRVMWLGDSITDIGVYVSLVEYFLDKDFPSDNFDIVSIGLSGEIVAKLDAQDQPQKHRCVLDRLGPALDKVKPEVVIACYGMNDGLYSPGNPRRLATFMAGVHELIDRSHRAGVKQVILITPPIFDPAPVKPEKRVEAGKSDTDYGFNRFFVGYDAVLAEESESELVLPPTVAQVIDVHTPMAAELKSLRAADPKTVFSDDGVHPNAIGNYYMAATILRALGAEVPLTNDLAADMKRAQSDRLCQLVGKRRRLRAVGWLDYVGSYKSGTTTKPVDIEDVEGKASDLQAQINAERAYPGMKPKAAEHLQ
jgi:lysophospholipase L1-like esterase